MKPVGILVITGVISLSVGVGSGMLLDFFRLEGLSLQYTINSAEMFPGEQTTGIVSVDMANVGRREVNDVFCRIEVPLGRIREHKVVGLLGSNEVISTTESAVEIRIPFFNPNDQFSVHLLLNPHSQTLPLAPVVDLRGRGVTGTQKVEPEGRELDLFQSTLPASVAIVVFVLSVPLVLLRMRAIPSVFGHSDDQRDIVAYVLGANEFRREAEDLRHSVRRLSYWSIVDELTERWLNTDDSEVMTRGVAVLDQLLAYALMHQSSKYLVRFNIARLLLRLEDSDRLKREIANLPASKFSLVSRRLRHNESLRKEFESTKSM